MLKNTIEKGIDEPVHEDFAVRARMYESDISDCPNGCKYYRDHATDLITLGHSSSYGCKRTKSDIQAAAGVSVGKSERLDLNDPLINPGPSKVDAFRAQYPLSGVSNG